MSTTFNNAIRGLDELKKSLAGLEAKAQRKIYRAAMRQGSNTIRDAARNLAPVGETGLLKRQIKTVSARAKPGTIRFQVRADARKTSAKYPTGYPYGLAVEAGHAAPGKRARLHGSPKAAEFGSSSTPPHPFMRPAWEHSKENVLTRIGQAIGQGIEKLADEERKPNS